MATKFAVIRTGGKQYLIKENDELFVDRLPYEEKKAVELETLATFTDEKDLVLGMPVLAKKTKAVILQNLKGDKIRVAKFKAKVRYRRVRGFRPQLSKIKIEQI